MHQRARGQLELFAAPEHAERIGPAPVEPALSALARRLPDGLRLGTSSWSFPGWHGLVFDRETSAERLAREGLAAYARHPLLGAVGIDRTYYAPLSASALAAYAAAVPSRFRFLVKAAGACVDPFRRDESGQRTANNPRFLDAAFARDGVVGPFVEGLAERGGPLVFQFPPLGSEHTRAPWRFAERLFEFLAALPRGPLYAVELRDRTLLCRDYIAALHDGGATHCLSLHPRMPPLVEQRCRAAALADRPLVVRWMLGPDLSYEDARRRYAPFSRLVDEDPDTRAALAALCLDHVRRGGEAFVIANNKAEGSAPLTLFRLAEAIDGARAAPRA